MTQKRAHACSGAYGLSVPEEASLSLVKFNRDCTAEGLG